jgi:transketolase
MSPRPVIASDSPATDAARAMGLRKAGPFSAVLCEVAREREEIVAMSADLRKYTDLLAFSSEFPDRYIEVGMAEQNLVAAAAGLARSGLTVVASSFAAFLSRRALDFTIMQVALARADVKLVGAVPGISATFGPSHTAIDDLAIMRAAPNMIVIDPCDPTETAQALRWALDYDGPVYLRQPFNRAATARPVSDSLPSFELGKCHVLREGTDLAIVAGGDRVINAVEAADVLAHEGIDATVVRSSSVKPFDADTIAEVAQEHRVLVTIENHSIYGGLFSAVSEVLARRGIGRRVTPLGVGDEFPPFGSPAHTSRTLGLDTDALVTTARNAVRARDHAA